MLFSGLFNHPDCPKKNTRGREAGEPKKKANKGKPEEKLINNQTEQSLC